MDEAATECGGGHFFANRAFFPFIIIFFLLAKACRQLKWNGRDVGVCRIKVFNDAREWTHHDHTASELPDNTRNV